MKGELLRRNFPTVNILFNEKYYMYTCGKFEKNLYLFKKKKKIQWLTIHCIKTIFKQKTFF